MDKFDQLEDQMCSILSIMTYKPRKKCDEYVKELNQGLLTTEQFRRQLQMEYGESPTTKIRAVMCIINNDNRGDCIGI